MLLLCTTQVVPLSIFLLLSARGASAATWYFIRYYTPSGAKFTSFSGDMVVPTLPKAGIYYLWPGLQPTDGSGVYQNVLDGRSGTWWFGSGWCCSNPDLPWGGGFNTYGGETVSFSNALESDNSGWTTTVIRTSTGTSETNTFPLASKSFDQVLFAIELDGVTWDFGPLAFENVTITSTDTNSAWCTGSPENYNGASVYTVTGAKAVVVGSTVICTIQSVVLQRPA